MTPQEAADRQTARRLTVHHVEGEGWVTLLPSGRRVRVPGAAGPVEAVEAAEVHLIAREAQAKEREARALLQEMQRGRYVHRVRAIEEDDGAGGTVNVVVFDIVRAPSGTATAIRDRRSVLAAWQDLVAALAAGGTP